MAVLEFEGVSFRYPVFNQNSRSFQLMIYRQLGRKPATHDRIDYVQALDNVTFKLKDGDRLGLVGQNGAGKTTLLRLIARVLWPTTGSIRIEGSLASYMDLGLGMDREASGWDNITFRCVFLGLTFKRARELAPSIAEFSGLGDHLSMPLRTYSAGMFLRLAFSITTAIQPDILVMDEMIGAGDAEFIVKTEQRVKSLLGRSKILVLASHDAAIIKKLCTKAAWIDKGRVHALGDTDEVLNLYHTHALRPIHG